MGAAAAEGKAEPTTQRLRLAEDSRRPLSANYLHREGYRNPGVLAAGLGADSGTEPAASTPGFR